MRHVTFSRLGPSSTIRSGYPLSPKCLGHEPSGVPQNQHVHSVLLIDDHDIVRFGLETLILSSPQLRLVGSAGTLAQALELIERYEPDLVVSDMNLPDSSGLNTVRSLVEAQAPRHTLIVSMQEESLYGPQVLSLGADGYLAKDTAHAHVLEAALKILEGGTWTSPRLNAILLNRRLRRHQRPEETRPAERERTLTLRELQVLEQLSQGKSTKEIAAALGLSVRTVDLHRSHIKKKLGLRTGAELIAFASHRL